MATSIRIRNATRDTIVASHATVATNPIARARGLIGRHDLNAGEALIIHPCNSVHCFFMSFPIDVIYVDRDYTVLTVAPSLAPNRLGPFVWRARDVIELPAGTAAATGTVAGDRLIVEPIGA